MITYEDVKRWKENSINTSREIGLFPEEVLDRLNLVDINIIDGFSSESLYGFVNYFKDGKLNPGVFVYSSNYSESIDLFFKLLKKEHIYSRNLKDKVMVNEKNLFELYNQSGMDHLLLGHIGSFLYDSIGDEEDAYEIESEVASYRAKKDKNWEFVVEFIPKFQAAEKRKIWHS